MRDDPAFLPKFDLLDAETKEWVDARASWIVKQFGAARIQSCPVVVPTEEFFPPNFGGTEEDARVELDRICDYLDLDPKTVELEVFTDNERVEKVDGAAGYYEEVEGGGAVVWIQESRLGEPLDMAATMAHELCHVHLLGHGRISDDADDHEPLTDLLTVFLGMGVVTANAVMHDHNWSGGGWEGYEIRRSGYLTMTIYGYALALFAEFRHESDVPWWRHLRPDVRHAFDKSRRFFRKHGAPDLLTVRTTDARPSLASTHDRVEKEQHGEPLVVGEGECCFCGAPVADREAVGDACDECQASIDDNDSEREVELRAAERAGWWRRRIGKGFLIGFVVFVIVVILTEWWEKGL